MKLVQIGTVAFDTIETPFGKSERTIGGAATYISLAASCFVERSGLVSVVGDDFPVDYLTVLQEKGVDLSGLQIHKGKKSFFWAGRYHFDMNSRDTLATELNVLQDFDPVLPLDYRNCEYLMLGNLDPRVQLKVIEQIPERPKLVVLDTMNFWMDTAMDDLMAVLTKVDVITINDAEARQLSGEYSLVKAAGKILTMGPRCVIIKKGEHGALLFEENKIFFAPALPLEEVVDPTGAGDTFAGGFIGYLAGTDNASFENMKRAIIVGSALASYTCEKFGTERLLEITREDIDRRIEEFVRLVDFDIEIVD